MFNKKRLEELEFQLSCQKDKIDGLNNRYWEIVEKLDLLTKHLGVKIEQKPSQKVVVKLKV